MLLGEIFGAAAGSQCTSRSLAETCQGFVSRFLAHFIDRHLAVWMGNRPSVRFELWRCMSPPKRDSWEVLLNHYSQNFKTLNCTTQWWGVASDHGMGWVQRLHFNPSSSKKNVPSHICIDLFWVHWKYSFYHLAEAYFDGSTVGRQPIELFHLYVPALGKGFFAPPLVGQPSSLGVSSWRLRQYSNL